MIAACAKYGASGEQMEDMKGGNAGSGSKNPKRANELNGRDWTKFSISVWNDVRKTPEEKRLNHPAMFPETLVNRLIRCFTKSDDGNILDPFMGSGSTLIAAHKLGRHGIGFEVNREYVELAGTRMAQQSFLGTAQPTIYHEDARNIPKRIGLNSIHLCVTSPPYWDILSQKRSADGKDIRDYGDGEGDLSRIHDYKLFVDGLRDVFEGVFQVLIPGKYCLVNVMDLRKKNQFFPLHSDLAARMQSLGYIFDDIILWDRRQEYNNLRCLGYPYVFRLNKIHEYILIFQKPRT